MNDDSIHDAVEELMNAAQGVVDSCRSIMNNFRDGKDHDAESFMDELSGDVEQVSISFEDLENAMESEEND